MFVGVCVCVCTCICVYSFHEYATAAMLTFFHVVYDFGAFVKSLYL